MFTGIIEETGIVQNITSYKISVKCKKVLENTKCGDSIALNGVCLTVTELFDDSYSADISPETFKMTNFGMLRNGDIVNLERALLLSTRLGGHIVSGHIDGVATISKISKNKEFYDLVVKLNDNQLKYVVKKGSIAISGISLTIADIIGDTIYIAVIPHTFENTNLKFLTQGSFVNIEVDILSKYVEKFLSTGDNKAVIDMDFLQRNGF